MATARKNTTTAAKVAPAEVEAQAAEAFGSDTLSLTVPTKKAPVDLLSSVARGLQVAPDMPTNAGGRARPNPFAEQVERTYTEGVVLSTAPLNGEEVVKVVRNAIIRAAQAKGYGLDLRSTEGSDGTVISFRARAKRAAKK